MPRSRPFENHFFFLRIEEKRIRRIHLEPGQPVEAVIRSQHAGTQIEFRRIRKIRMKSRAQVLTMPFDLVGQVIRNTQFDQKVALSGISV